MKMVSPHRKATRRYAVSFGMAALSLSALFYVTDKAFSSGEDGLVQERGGDLYLAPASPRVIERRVEDDCRKGGLAQDPAEGSRRVSICVTRKGNTVVVF